MPRPLVPSLAALASLTMLCTLALDAAADSKVIVQNNTTKTLTIDTASTLPGKHWKKGATKIGPGKRATIYETNRDQGVTNGEDFWFTSSFDADGFNTGPKKLRARLHLRGATVGSHMWQSATDQWDHESPWEDDDGKKWTSKWKFGGKTYGVDYWSFGTGGDSDVEFVIKERYPLPEGNGVQTTQEWRASHLNVLSWNVYMRPTSLFKNGQSIRAALIPDKIPGYDVVVFQEAFDDDVRADLISRMKAAGYPHVSDILGEDEGAAQDGGVIIVSKWPIVVQKQKLFGNVCEGWDCEAQKGVLYVAIDKTTAQGKKTRFHVFGTHLQDGAWSIRKQQLGIMRSFIDAQSIPKGEAVLMAGDFNINMANTEEHAFMLQKLGATYVTGSQLRGHRFTHDGPANDLGEGSQSYYDYVLASVRHRKPTTASYAEVRLLRAESEWKEFEHEHAMWDLSDHFPVYASWHFENSDLSDWDPGSDQGGTAPATCKVDADCPVGMKCVFEVAPPGKTATATGPAAATASKGNTKAMGRVGGGAKPKAQAGGGAIGPLPKVGRCRVPPPK